MESLINNLAQSTGSVLKALSAITMNHSKSKTTTRILSPKAMSFLGSKLWRKWSKNTEM